MIEGSKQKRILDWNMVRGLLEKPFNPALQTKLLSEESREFYDAYRANDMVGMIDAYCDFIFVLRGAQASLIATDFKEDYQAYQQALTIVNGAVNQGFLILELLAKVVPLGKQDLEECLLYVIEANEAKPSKTDATGKVLKGDTWVDPKERIKNLIFGNKCDEEA